MDLPEVSPASNRTLHQSEIVRWPTFPDLKPNSTLHALSCTTPLFAFPHLPQNDIPSKLRMGQDLLPHLSSSNTDRDNPPEAFLRILRSGRARAIRWRMEWDTALGGRSSLTSVPIRWRPAIFFAVSLLGCGGAVGPVSPQPPPQVVVRCCLKNVFAATQSAPSTKKNPAMIGPGSPFGMESTRAYWA